MANYYAVKEGKTPGIYETWGECEKQIKGYSNAVYKKFKTKKEALEFIEDGIETKIYNIDDIEGDTNLIKNIKSEREEIIESEEIEKLKSKIKKLESRIIELENLLNIESVIKIKEEENIIYNEGKNNSNLNIKENEIIAYVDGSYKNATKEYSYGMILFTTEGEEEYCEKYKNEFSEMRNVAGEIQGAMKAMEIAIEKNKNKLYLYYDYMGIEKWAKEEWKANKKGTQMYRDYYKNIKNKLEVIFVKVEAHTGDKYNEVADKLAKKALGI